ncbi:hypothetical protein AAFF_G00316020 [Aldrovandia affinis]|uniref:Uncharacterized protein n=1 Tax=Aldrovandia affinis TaxID=143900 RepID=A0AAD7SP71_9TELE|nr:hypothetical protein AAFF_G00316020 [Aldrovandia affinis]
MPDDEADDMVEQLCQRSSEGLIEQECNQLRALLTEFRYLFATKDRDCTRTTITQHHIKNGAAVPIRQRARRLPLAKWEEAEAMIRKRAAAGITQPSESPWVSPAMLFSALDLHSGYWQVPLSPYAVALTNLRTVFQLIAKANLHLNPTKCSLFC